MVWPHNNDIGKEKPEEPVSPPIWAIMDEEMKAITNEAFAKGFDNSKLYGMDPGQQPSYWLQPNANKTPPAKPMELDSLLKEIYSGSLTKSEAYAKLYGHTSIHGKDPVLIDGPKGNYKFFDPSPFPTTINPKQIRMVLRFDGPEPLIKDKLGSSYLLPDKEITESELRRILQEQFKSMEDLIINNLKKAKGIK